MRNRKPNRLNDKLEHWGRHGRSSERHGRQACWQGQPGRPTSARTHVLWPWSLVPGWPSL